MEEIKKQLKKLDKLKSIETKIDIVDRKTLNMKFTRLETKVDGVDDRLKVTEENVQCISQSQKHFQTAGRKCEIAQIINEHNGRQYNNTLGNLKQQGQYEDKAVSLQKDQGVLSNVLKIPNADQIIIADTHRLPSSNDSGRKPLIFKLAKMTDKTKIWDHLEELKAWNENCNADKKVYVDMINLQAKLAKDRKELLEDYKLAQQHGRKSKWRFIKNVEKNICEYGYKIGDTFYGPKNNNFNFMLNVANYDKNV